MPASSRSKRVLIYSHDSFGLGHVSRCRTIANALVEADESVSVLILSGSPMIGSYEFHSGIDFVRVPGVVKQLSGDYDSANLRVGVEHTMEMRTRIIRDTADIFRPDLFIVDKEPLGLRGEVGPALHLLKERGTPLVLGLRDVMDDPAALAQEWERKKIVPALRDLYDEIWIYGLPQINKPLTGIDVPPSVRHKMVYTGYLHRELPLHADIPHEIEEIDRPFILVTSGGGGDGEDRLTDALHFIEGENGIVVKDRAVAVVARDVGGDDDIHHAGRSAHRRQVHATDAAVRHCAHAQRRMQRAGRQDDVVGVNGLPRDVQVRAVVPERCADDGAAVFTLLVFAPIELSHLPGVAHDAVVPCSAPGAAKPKSMRLAAPIAPCSK